MKVIFLDFDGVLVTHNSPPRGCDSACVGHLNEIVRRTGANIVVSSTWRMFPNYKDILKKWGVAGSVIGCTPLPAFRDDINLYAAKSRGQEILDWISGSPGFNGEFCILDDDPDMGMLINKLIRTHPAAGLQASDVEAACKMLGEL